MTKKATAFLIIIVGALILGWAGAARADQPVTFEPGTGKYILVLEDPRTEIDDPVTGKKRAREPDVQKHGGTVLHKKDATRVIKLPTRAAVALRKEENVAYLQRIWLGESREEWGEEAQQSSLKTAVPETLDTDLTWTTGTYLYDGSGNIKQIGTDTYRYDTLGRLAQAVVKGITETYQYDSFGNLVGKTVNGQPRPIPVDASSNRLQGEAYDAAGNVTTQAGQPRYRYDSFSMVDRWERPPSNRKRYIYGPDDERIGTVLQEGSFSRWKIRDFSGKVLREFKADDTQGYWEWIEDYAYGDARLLAAERESYYGGKRHFHTDHLGSVRMITDQSRKRIAVHDFSAFGVEQTDAAQEYNRYAGAGGGGDFRAEPMKFTGHERDQHGWLNVDTDDSLDYMHARYYDPNLGRFLSVDPAGYDLQRPQSWNRYSYVLNNPVNLTDPTGRCVWDICIGEATAAVVVLTTATAYALAPSSVPGKSNGDVMVDSAIDGFQAVGTWLLNGSGGSNGEMAAETMINNWQRKEGEAADSAPTSDPKRRFSKGDRQAGLDKSKDAEGTPRCEYCGTALIPRAGSGNSYEGDHRDPHAQGGRTTQENLAPSCRDCNREKGNRTPEQWKKDKEKEQ